LSDPDTGLAWELTFDHTTAEAHAVASYSSAVLDRIVRAVLVGYDAELTSEALQAVLKRERHLVQKGETIPSLTALDAMWLDEGRIDEVEAERWAAANLETYLKMKLDDLDVALTLPEFVSLGRWSHARRLIEKSGADNVKTRTVSRIALALADDPALARDPSSAPMRQARDYMKRHMSETWLSRGGAREAMHWLRLVEWRNGESGLSPRETLLRAFAYMGEVEPPEAVRAEIVAIDARVGRS
jgi:hypothetical protein